MVSRAVVSYKWQGAAMLRATTSPGPADLPLTLDLDDLDVTRRWVVGVWQREEVRDALRAASPGLCRAVETVVCGAQARSRQVRRTALSVASYLLRWQHRPTPFGLFAGTAPMSVGPVPRASWGVKRRALVRADAEWISDIIQRLQQNLGLLERLPLVPTTSPGCVVTGWSRRAGPRTVMPFSWPRSRYPYVSHGLCEPPCARPGSPSGTATCATTSTACSRGRPRAGRCAAGRSPRAESADHQPVGSDDHRGRARTCLRRTGEGRRPLPGGRRRTGARPGRDPYRPDQSRTARSTSTLSDVTERMLTLSSVTPAPLLIDTVLDCDVQIPEAVVREAQAAVAALHRITPHPYGYQQWRDYHRCFRARYGVGASVPVLDLVADSGLGLPAEYIGSERGRAPRTVTDRDDVVLSLVQQALMEGRDELLLTDAAIADLAASVQDPLFVPRVEVAFEIHAASCEALARGAFQLVLTGVPRPGSSMAGRFVHLVPPDQQEAWARTYRTTGSDAITGQLSFVPRRRRNENVARTPRLLSHVIGLSEHRAVGDDVIPLTDIAVTADARRFHLIHLSSGRPIDVCVPHALEAGVQTPPLARFLAEIATARCAVYQPFAFGAAARMPYLPRVRYRKTVLAPARWLLTAQDLPGRTASTLDWERAFGAWRTRLHVPDRVAMVEIDQRLPLDLTHPVHRRLLRSRLDEAGRLELREAAHPDAHGWIGRAHEVLLPLIRTQPEENSTLPTPTRVTPVNTEDAHLPGVGTVLRAHVHAHPQRYDEILDSHLPVLLAEFGAVPPPWWFARHRELARPEADRYLTLYVRLTEPAAYGRAAERIGAWVDGLRRQRLASHLVFATYEPQAGRYGHGLAMDAAHAVFAADSAVAVAQLRMADQTGIFPQALAAASVVDLAARFAPSAEQGLQWLVQNLPRERGPLDRALSDQARALADPHGTGTALCSLPGGAEVATTWQDRATALTAYRKQLTGQRDPLTVLCSLHHLHHVRALGADPDRERVTGRLARACALRHTAHRQET